jgi:hypothetical protein
MINSHQFFYWGELVNSTKLYHGNYSNHNILYFETLIKTTNISQECKRSIFDTLKTLNNNEYWSYKMLNSWGKFQPSAIFKVTVAHFSD